MYFLPGFDATAGLAFRFCPAQARRWVGAEAMKAKDRIA